MESHDWKTFTEDLVICDKCGVVEDDVSGSEVVLDGDCTPDEMLGDSPWQ